MSVRKTTIVFGALIIAAALTCVGAQKTHAYRCVNGTVAGDQKLLAKYGNLFVHFYDECAQKEAETNGTATYYGNKKPNSALAVYGATVEAQNQNILASKIQNYNDHRVLLENYSIQTIAEDFEQKTINATDHYVMIDTESLLDEPAEIIEKSLKKISKHAGEQNYLIVISPRKLNEQNNNLYQNLKTATAKISNAEFIDWISYAENSDDKNALYDGEKLSSFGEMKYANLVNDSFIGGITHTEIKNNDSIIWDYFADSQIANFADTPEAIASLIATAEQLTSANPFYRNTLTNQIGLFATADAELEKYLAEHDLANLWNTQQDYGTTQKMIYAQLDFAFQKNGQAIEDSRLQRKLAKYLEYVQNHHGNSIQGALENYTNELYDIFPELNIKKPLVADTTSLYYDAFLISRDYTGTNDNIIANKELSQRKNSPINASTNIVRKVVNGKILMLDQTFGENTTFPATTDKRNIKDISIYFKNKSELHPEADYAKNPHIVYDISTGKATQYVNLLKNSYYAQDFANSDIKILITTSKDLSDAQFYAEVANSQTENWLPLAKIILAISDAYDFEFDKSINYLVRDTAKDYAASSSIIINSKDAIVNPNTAKGLIDAALNQQLDSYRGVERN